jgi:hypothetical protein
MDEVNKIWTPKKKRSKDADVHNPSETAFSTPSEILVHRGVCILNVMAQLNLGDVRIIFQIFNCKSIYNDYTYNYSYRKFHFHCLLSLF